MADNQGSEGGSRNEPQFSIVVNGRQKFVTDRHVTFEQVVYLAFNPVPSGPDVVFTVTYRNADRPREGSLVAGSEAVLVKPSGTIFDVQHSNKS